MLTIVLMVIATAASVYFLLEMGRADRDSVAEIIMSKAWSNRFSKQTLEEKRSSYLWKNERYHLHSPKTVQKKLKSWDKQIARYSQNDEAYSNGRTFSLMDIIPLFGYQFLVDLKIDSNSDILRSLVRSCEHTGYNELERDRVTVDKKNSFIYAYYVLASLFSFLFIGIILACFLGVVVIAAGNEIESVIMIMAVSFAAAALYGYIPYESLRSYANKRQDELDTEFPNAISKIALLVTAGMNITNAITETANSGDSLIYRELRSVVGDLGKASTVQSAFQRMQCRCDNRYLDKMVTIITKSYIFGNRDLADDLKEINDECWLDKKHNARRMGERVQTKLFIPTMLMFIGVLVVIIIPAMSGFNL